MTDDDLSYAGLRLAAGALTDAPGLALEHQPVPPDQVVAGSPTTAYLALDRSAAGEIGVWEMSVGTMWDIEVDEVFVVVAGSQPWRSTPTRRPGWCVSRSSSRPARSSGSWPA